MTSRVRRVVDTIKEEVLKNINQESVEVFFNKNTVGDVSKTVYFEKGETISTFNGVGYSHRYIKDITILYNAKNTYVEVLGLTPNEKREVIRGGICLNGDALMNEITSESNETIERLKKML